MNPLHQSRMLWELGEVSPLSLRLRETALPYLLTLYEATAENVHLAVLDGFEALYVARLVGPRSVPVISRMGGACRCTPTGLGKVLLAREDGAFVSSYLSGRWSAPPSSPSRLCGGCGHSWPSCGEAVTARPARR